MKILVLDNYDSFTYNLVHLLEKACDFPVEVHRNDKIELKKIDEYDKILLSPGPGLPNEAGILPDVIKEYGGKKDILGVCLGLQAIGESFGGKLKNLDNVYHGIATPVQLLKEDVLFKDCPKEFKAGRYHSWVVDTNGLPDCFDVTATDESGNIMALKHKTYKVKGVQFHPESVLSEYGEQIIKNWVFS
ncbi:MAG TPA: aminodeoxychorismate/anthranilate synthase component II [Bacteroidia bacterium]|jgi:anthranilate synthase component 2|nr:aminodeoxychorismate/anthranilate synthase component II [Bacteroidia bacterium]